MSRREVNLVIRAKDEAKKTLANLSSALDDLSNSQGDVAKSGEGVDNLLSRLGSEFKALNAEIQGLTALKKLTGELDRAKASLTGLEAATQRSKAGAAQLVSSYGQAVVGTRKLKQSADLAEQSMRKQESAIERTKAEIAQLKTSIDSASPAYRSLRTEINRTKQPSDDLAQRYRAQRDSIISLVNSLANAEKELTQQKGVLAGLKQESREAAQAYRVADTNQRRLRESAAKATTEFSRQRQELGRSRAALAQAGQSVANAQKVLGGVGSSQAEISEASKRAADDLDRVSRALKNQQATAQQTSEAAVGPAAQAAQAYRSQVQAVRDAERAWRSAQGEANRLGTAVRNAANPSRELQTSFVLSQASSRDLRAEYIRQAQALRQLRGVKQGSFAEFSRSADAMRAEATASKQSAASARDLARSWGLLPAKADRAAASANRLGRQLQRTERRSRAAMSMFQRMRGEIISLTVQFAGLYGAIRGVGSVIDSFRSLEAVENRLGAVFNQDTSIVRDEVRFLREEAIRLGISFQVLGDEYSKLSVATRAAGFAQEDTRKLFLAVAEAGRVNKLSIDQVRGTFLALQQMISKGRVMSEELRRQLGDRLPGAFHILADALDVSTVKLEEMLKNGEVLADRSTMLKFADALNRRFGAQLPKSLESLTAQMARFDALLFDLQMRIAEAGFAEELRVALDTLNQGLQTSDLQSFVQAMSSLLSGLAKAIVFVVQNVDLLAFAFKTLLSIKLAQFFLGATSALARFVAASTAAQAAVAATAVNVRAFVVALRGLQIGAAAAAAGMVALQGTMAALIAVAPALAAAGAVFVGLTLLTDWLSDVDEATDAAYRHAAALDRLAAEYRKAGGAVEDFSDKVRESLKQELERDADRLQDALQSIRDEAEKPLTVLPFTDEARTYRLLETSIDLFRAGTTSADEFRTAVEAMAKAHPDMDDEVVQLLIDIAEKARDAEKKLKETDAGLRLVAETATEVDRELLERAGVLQFADALGNVSPEAEQAEKALLRLKSLIPRLAAEARRLKKIDALAELVAQLRAAGPLTKEMLDLIAERRRIIEKEFRDSGKDPDSSTDDAAKLEERIKESLERQNVTLKKQNELSRLAADLKDETARKQAMLTARKEAELEFQYAGIKLDAAANKLIEERVRLVGEQFDLEKKAREEAEKLRKLDDDVNVMLERRRLLMDQITFQEGQGNESAAAELRQQLEATEDQLVQLADKAIAAYQEIGGPEAENAILRLQGIKQEVQAVGESFEWSGESINKMLRDGGVQVFDRFAEAIANGKNAVESLRMAFMQFASDFLREIAQMIARQAFLNALQGAGGSNGGIGGFISGLMTSLFHDGGIAGQSARGRVVSPAWFANALRYHGGGVAGLKPGEVPAILEKGEEVLTEDSPRHIANGGGQAPGDVKIVNAIDSGSFISEGLNTTNGEKAILNFIRANSGAVRNAMGV